MELDETARGRLIRTAVSLKEQVRAVLMARIVLAAADGLSIGAIARELAVHVNTVRKWHGRFAAQGPEGLKDASRSGRPKTHGPQVALTIAATAISAPPHPRTRKRPVTPDDRRKGRQRRFRRYLRLPGWPDPGRPGPQAAPGTRLAHPP
ncbi:helix-turn-helix domain-containing protein [Streptomyces sp. NBC_00005]|uniref:helix-turn-helix domain-containing protein n=1 Tax=Streptomyces sp. NBC_00005 TaxID=2903609 RepID=UPI00386F81F0